MEHAPTVYLDQVPLAMQGQQSPIFGRTWSFLRRVPVALNEAGDHAFGGRLSGDPASDQLLVWNGIALIQEGDSLPAIAPHTFTDLRVTGLPPADLRLSESGQILWYGEWSDPDANLDSGLFLDHQLVLQEGVTWIDGAQIDDFTQSALFPERPIFDMSTDGTTIAFRAVLTDGRIGAFRIRPKGGLETINGCVPNAGILESFPPKLNQGLTFTLKNAQADGIGGVVFLSLQTALGFPPCGLPLPGVGEILVNTLSPDPFLVLPGLFPAINGLTLVNLGVLPNNPKLFGLSFYAQGLWIDTLGVVPTEPFRLSNALSMSIGQ